MSEVPEGLPYSPSSDSDRQPRKKMRKGTHSCQECRRRKIRCVIESEAQICNHCTARGLKCIDQEHGDADIPSTRKRKNMQDRIGELEGMIGHILKKLDHDGDESTMGKTELDAAEVLRSLQSELLPTSINSVNHTTSPSASRLPSPESTIVSEDRLDNAPVMALFDNSILARGKSGPSEDDELLTSARGPESELENAKTTRVLVALKSLVPNDDDMTSILQATVGSLGHWQKLCPELLGDALKCAEADRPRRLRLFIDQSLKSDKVAAIAKTILFLALCIQQLPKSFDYSRTSLPSPSHAIKGHYINCIETLLVPDEGLASTIDGIECMVAQTKYYVYMGNPQKAWLILRRAISFFHLMGSHRHLFKATDASTVRKRCLWLQLWNSDKQLALLLGLPYCIAESHFNLTDLDNELLGMPIDEIFILRISMIAGHIVDRNQNPSKMNYSDTLKIDRELEEARSLLPAEWGRERVSASMVSQETLFAMAVARFTFHNVRKLLHLPYMLKSTSDPRYEFSRIATIDASREMIWAYQELQHLQSAVLKFCNMSDFLVFSAAMVLIIDLFRKSGRDARQEDRDWNLVYSITQNLKQVSERMPCTIARQSARLLEDMSACRGGCTDCDPGQAYEAVIPYLGKVRLTAGSELIAQCNTPQGAMTASSDSANPQLFTPPEDAYPGSSDRAGVDPLVSFDGYLHPPAEGQPQQPWDLGTDWTALIDSSLQDDWSLFMTGDDHVSP